MTRIKAKTSANRSSSNFKQEREKHRLESDREGRFEAELRAGIKAAAKTSEEPEQLKLVCDLIDEMTPPFTGRGDIPLRCCCLVHRTSGINH